MNWSANTYVYVFTVYVCLTTAIELDQHDRGSHIIYPHEFLQSPQILIQRPHLARISISDC